MIEIYVVRHGMTEFNKNHVIIGHLDPSLLKSGMSSFGSPIIKSSKLDIKKLATHLKNIEFDGVYTSDLKRAVQTTNILTQERGYLQEIILSPSLKEIDYGILAGKSKTEIKKNYLKYHNDINYINPAGESFNELYLRVTNFLESIINNHKKILIVTHAGCIRAIYSYFNNEKFQENINMKLNQYFIMKCTLDGKGNKKAEIIYKG